MNDAVFEVLQVESQPAAYFEHGMIFAGGSMSECTAKGAPAEK